MNTAAEKKPTITSDKKTVAPETATPAVDAIVVVTTAPEKRQLRICVKAINALDAERTELVKNTIENIKPGKPFDSGVVRDINKLETRKNRLIVARFASLLKKSGPEVQAIVHQIIEF